jgi:hypothetical protein
MLGPAERASRLTTLWQRRWPACVPIAHELPSCYPDRWVRFHSLPGSKRYAQNAHEYSIILERHNSVLVELQSGSELLVITCEWTQTPDPEPYRSPVLARLDPDGVHWRTDQQDLDDDPDFVVYWQLYVSQRPWRHGAFDDLLRAVADDEIGNVIIGPSDLRWLYHPYDGGADVVLATRAGRDALKDRHAAWLSNHVSGL